MARPRAIIAYIPVLHEGYRKLLANYPGATLYILDRKITSRFPPLTKDLRALDPQLVKASIVAWKLNIKVEIASEATIRELAGSSTIVVMPDEDISRHIADNLLPGTTIEYSPLFLRWDRRRSDSKEELSPDHSISENEVDISRLSQASKESWHSSDIWRRVGAALVSSDGKLLPLKHNQSMPTDNTPWALGDPRGNYTKGVSLDLSLFIHAEAAAIADAARIGKPLNGASIYVTTFPCPACAKLIVAAGITKCYYATGYAVLDGEDVMRSAGVEIIQVKVNLEMQPGDVWADYPQKTN